MLRTIAELLVGNLIEIVMLSAGLRVQPERLLAEIRRPALAIRELLVLGLGVPLLTLLVVLLLPVPPRARVVAVLFGICPAAPVVLQSFQKRETAASKALAVVVIALAASLFIVPSWIWALNRFFALGIRLSPETLFSLLALKVFVPLFLGMAVHRFVPRVAELLGRVLTVVMIVGLLLALVVLVAVGAGTLRLVTLPVIVAVVLVATGCAIRGEIAGGSDPELREILGRTAMMGNPALALAIIAASYPSLDIGGLVAAYLICRGVSTLPYSLFAWRQSVRRQGSVHST
jgi:bile acid:Na+ symporter, BASS family